MSENDSAPKELSEDEQFAAATADNPLFDDGMSNAPDADAIAMTGAADATDTAEAAKGTDNTAKDAREATDDATGAHAAASEDATAATDAPASDVASDEPFAGYSTLSDEARTAYDTLRAEREKVENDYKALHGMTAPLQRGNAELRRQAEAMMARIQQLEQLERKQQDVSAAKDATIQEFDEWAKQYPEESQAVIALVNPLREKVTALEGSLNAARAELGTLHADRQQAALARELSELERVHSDWRAIHGSTEYWEWLNQQAPGIQSLNDSMFAGDAVQLLNMYKASHAPALAPAPRNPPPNTATQVQQRRKQVLARGTQPTVKTSESAEYGASPDGALTDEDAQFASLVADNPLFK